MLIWLASYPRSGNTLLRIILNHAFGLKTYSLYNDIVGIGADKATTEIVGHQFLSSDFQIADADTSQKLWLVKTHDYPVDDSKAIYIIRDGREALTSYLFYRKCVIGDRKTSLRDLIKGSVRFGSWSDHLAAWSPLERPDTLFLRFEDLTADPEKHLVAMANFLNKEPLPHRIPTFAELQAINPKFFRSGQNDTWKTVFTEEDDRLFWRLHGDAMARYGYS